jgi:hypothetical protein
MAIAYFQPVTRGEISEMFGREISRDLTVDQEGYVLDEIVQIHRNTKATRHLLTRLLRKQGCQPKRIITDKLGSYGAAVCLNLLRCPKSFRRPSFSPLNHLNPPSSPESDGGMENLHYRRRLNIDRSAAVAPCAS